MYYTPLTFADSLVCFAVRTPADQTLSPACGDKYFMQIVSRMGRDMVAAEKACERTG